MRKQVFVLLVEREIRSTIRSPRFAATFGVCSLLIVMSVFVGIQEFKRSVSQYESSLTLTETELRAQVYWNRLGFANRAFRNVEPTQILVSGASNDIGRQSEINMWTSVRLKNSHYSDDPLFAVFRFFDFTFIVQVVLSLFAILYTYDRINGERESGTLRMVLSNSIPRVQIVIAKLAGAWLGLTIPLVVPILLGVLLILLFGVPAQGDDWWKIASVIGVSILYFTFFIALGICVSAITKRSATSFLLLLAAWLIMIAIIPGLSTMVASQMVKVSSISEIESKKERYAVDRWARYSRDRRQIFEQRRNARTGLSAEEAREFWEEHQAELVQEEEELRWVAAADVHQFSQQLEQDLSNQKAALDDLAFKLSRFSPTSAYQLAVMNIAGTNVTMKRRYERSMHEYRMAVDSFVNTKRLEQRNQPREKWAQYGEEPLDLSQMPRYQPPRQTFSDVLVLSIVDVGLLALYTLLAVSAGFVAFLRYDVR